MSEGVVTQLKQVDQPLAEIIKLLQEIDLDAPMAKLNETTISDNNGGRIEL